MAVTTIKRVKLLDHGYLDLVEHWGSDERIIEAARMSTGKGFQGWGTQEKPGDERLLKYLWTNQHTTPFEMAGASFEVQAPIFVFREWHRHRTQSYNEMSARYTPLPDVNYVPTVERLMIFSGHVTKQSGTVAWASTLTQDKAQHFREEIQKVYQIGQEVYEQALAMGVPKELARIHLPVGRYSRMRASANLLNWLKFLKLRCHETAQFEIRQYANAVRDVLTQLFPRTLSLFEV